MAVKYSEIRNTVDLFKLNSSANRSALLTHYWQNYKSGLNGESYPEMDSELKAILQEPQYDYQLPLEFDVPFPPPANPDFTFIDLFAGIGGFRIAFQKLNGKCVLSSEWDKYAQKTYEANFGEVPFGDITEIDENKIPDHDILVGGFPCQPFSIAGVSKKNALGRNHGFLDETQGTLFFDIARIIRKNRPKAFLLENVKNLRSHDGKNTFRVIKGTLEELEYHVFDDVLDAKYYVPQHRERIFIAGFSKDYFDGRKEFCFPVPPDNPQQIGRILENNPDPKYTLTDNLWTYLQNYAAKHKAKGNGFGFGLINKEGISRTLSARYYKDGSEILIPMGKGKNPRRLTPEECKKLMGYPEKFNIQDIGVSEMQLYKQFGNSVAVPLVSAVAKNLVKYMEDNSREKPVSLRKKSDSLPAIKHEAVIEKV